MFKWDNIILISNHETGYVLPSWKNKNRENLPKVAVRTSKQDIGSLLWGIWVSQKESSNDNIRTSPRKCPSQISEDHSGRASSVLKDFNWVSNVPLLNMNKHTSSKTSRKKKRKHELSRKEQNHKTSIHTLKEIRRYW